jgi:tetratricopeptide (TPR) repeat protein
LVILGEELEQNIDNIALLNNALRYFPNQKNLTLALISRLPSRYQAQELLNQFLKVDPKDADMQLYYRQYFAPVTSTQKIGADLWDIFNNNLYHSRLAQYMVWFFLGVNNDYDAQLVLDHFKGDDNKWLNFYKALIYVSKGNLVEAKLLLKGYEKLLWQAHFNLALIDYINGNFNEAVVNFNAALALYQQLPINNGQSAVLESLIYSRLASSYLALGNKDLARKTAEKSLQIYIDQPLARGILRASAI